MRSHGVLGRDGDEGELVGLSAGLDKGHVGERRLADYLFSSMSNRAGGGAIF